MFKAIVAVMAALFVSVGAQAAGHHHTETVCSAQNANVCAHLGMHDLPTSKAEAKLIAHFFTPGNALVSNLKADLWMPDMGHGSAPVEIKDAGNNHYIISKAQFVMPGAWLVRLDFDFEGAAHHIEIPVTISE